MNNNYKWDKKYILKQYFLLKEEHAKKNLSEDDKLMYEFCIESLKELLKSNKYNSIIKNYPYLFVRENNFKELSNNFFRNEITKFQNNILSQNINLILSNNNNFIYNNKVLKKNIYIDDQIDLIKKYYSFNDKTINMHNILFDSNNNLLNITKKIGFNSFFRDIENGYITNKNDNTIEDFMALCHEVGHYDDFINTNGRLDKKSWIDFQKITPYFEVYSIFYELISIYILKNNRYINNDESLFLYNDILIQNTHNIEYLQIFKNINKDNIKLIRHLDTKIFDIALYSYSYLIAVSLFEQFLVDKNKALNNLNYIINNVTQNNESKVLRYCDIDLYNSFEIKKHINKMKRN